MNELLYRDDDERGQKHLSRLFQVVNRKDRFLVAQDFTCPICGEMMLRPMDLNFDHVQPVALGGRAGDNLLLAHARCNVAKGDRPPTEAELSFLSQTIARLRP